MYLFFWPLYVACGNLVPWTGIEPLPPAMEVCINHWTTREVQANGRNKNGGQMIALVENRIYPFSPEEREAGHFCYHGVNSPLCPGKTQDTVVQPPRWESQLKVCATHLWPPNKYLGRMTSQCQISPQAHYPTPQESQKSKVRYLVGTWMGASFLSVRITPWPDPWISMWCSFRNLTCLCMPYMLARGSSIVRFEEINGDGILPDQDTQWYMFHSRYSAFQQVCSRTTGTQWRLSRSPSPRSVK